MNPDDIILTNTELNFILKFINANENLFKENKASPNRKNLTLFKENKASPNRKNLTLFKESNIPTLFFDIKKRILNKENIVNNYIDDSTYGDYIGFITNGGKIHYHNDPTIPGYDHIRFNLFLSVPTKGGLPIYNGVTIPVTVGDYVRCNSSKEYHECGMVEGNVPRIVISYGIYLKQEETKLLNYQ